MLFKGELRRAALTAKRESEGEAERGEEPLIMISFISALFSLKALGSFGFSIEVI